MSTIKPDSSDSPEQFRGDTVPDETTENQSESKTADAPAVSLDEIFEVLKNSRRRKIIRYLRDDHQTTTLSDLAEHVAALENDTDVNRLTSSQRKRVYVALYQCHLPKMADMGVIEFDKNRGTVERSPNANQFEKYLQTDKTGAEGWYRYYLAVGSLGLGLSVLLLFANTQSFLGATSGLGLVSIVLTACAIGQASYVTDRA